LSELCDTGIGECVHRNENNRGYQEEVTEINEHIKKEQNRFQYRIGQCDVLKWVLEE
jgi:hypothetical protein